MLLKGIGEVETAPDRRAAAEMVLIRLCHVSDLPSPGDLVRRLSASGGAPAAPAQSAPGGRGWRHDARRRQWRTDDRAVAAGPRLANFRDVVALVKDRREAMLHAHLLHSVHLVRFAPPVMELRTKPDAPRDLAPKTGPQCCRKPPARAGRSPCRPREANRRWPSKATRRNAARREEAADHPADPRHHGGISGGANRLGTG